MNFPVFVLENLGKIFNQFLANACLFAGKTIGGKSPNFLSFFLSIIRVSTSCSLQEKRNTTKDNGLH